MPDARIYSKEERKLRKHLAQLISSVRLFEMQIDNLYRPDNPISNVERGKAVAEYMNQLVYTNDSALYFGLGFDYRKDAKEKRQHGTNIKAIMKHGARIKDVV